MALQESTRIPMTGHKAHYRLSSIAMSLLMVLSLTMASVGTPVSSASLTDVLQPVKHKELPGTETQHGHKSAGRSERQLKASLISDTGANSDNDDSETEQSTLRALPLSYDTEIVRHAFADYTVQVDSPRYRSPPGRAPPV